MNHFDNKVAVVTGGASGLGRALCIELSRNGANCVVTDVNIDGAQEVARKIVKNAGRASAVQTDTTDSQAVQVLIDNVCQEFGRIDYMFNNAGMIIGGEVRDMNLEHWRAMIDVNLFGVIYGTTSAYSVMVKQGFGHIINISSISGLTGLPTYTAYATTKHAIVGLSTSLRAEAVDLGVNVSVVCPGQLNTNLGKSALVLNANPNDVPKAISKERMITEPSIAAQQILRGVRKNKGIIVLPLSSRLFWWLNRLHPRLLAPVERIIVKNFRTARVES